MMKMILVLILSCVLSVSADVFHEDINVIGCSDTDGEVMYCLDNEVLWYADFQKKVGVEPQPDFVQHVSYQEGTYESAEANKQICIQNLKTARKAYKDIPKEQDPPSTPVVYSRDVEEEGVKNTLICYVTGFYPAPVTIRWTKNGNDVSGDATLSLSFPNKDSSFYQFSKLSYVPQHGDLYRCGVEHQALKEPVAKIWNVDLQQPSVGPTVFCGVGLTLGLLGVACGTFFLIKGNECS